MILPIQENQLHKYIKVRARACSVCGAKSEWVEKTYYIDCNKVDLQIVPKSKTITHKRIDSISNLLPSVYVANNEPCLRYYYEVSDADFKEVTTASNVSIDTKLSIVEKIETNQKQLYLSVRALCTKSETWKSEQVNIYYNVEKEFLYTPSILCSTSDNSFFGYLHKSDFVRLCIPSVAENTKIKFTIDGSEPTQSANEYGETVGDYIQHAIYFDKEGDYTIRAVSSVNGKYSPEKRIVVKVREVVAIQGDTNAVVTVDGGNKFILGEFVGGN